MPAPDLAAHEEKTIGVGALAIQRKPAPPRRDHLLEHGKAFKRHADRGLDAIEIHEGERLATEEGAVQSRLEYGIG